ncbi:hypothetical protein SKAU_G00140660 [Synaphobranchus kaupii]|uniref:Uncharacterized protein n=1 Tax=Synaphobranchus kaupii TaxID=118154 RepID=A0A9Q1FT36_SYNKA|nr:hypothetical protein SKAU_G00140660 [Synaphobranchus kaupii]
MRAEVKVKGESTQKSSSRTAAHGKVNREKIQTLEQDMDALKSEKFQLDNQTTALQTELHNLNELCQQKEQALQQVAENNAKLAQFQQTASQLRSGYSYEVLPLLLPAEQSCNRTTVKRDNFSCSR